jgi:hypothetical protein
VVDSSCRRPRIQRRRHAETRAATNRQGKRARQDSNL